jgi:hypothetical protein
VYRTGLIPEADGADRDRLDHTRVVFPDIDDIADRKLILDQDERAGDDVVDESLAAEAYRQANHTRPSEQGRVMSTPTWDRIIKDVRTTITDSIAVARMVAKCGCVSVAVRRSHRSHSGIADALLGTANRNRPISGSKRRPGNSTWRSLLFGGAAAAAKPSVRA